jgi:hypothetical protein
MNWIRIGRRNPRSDGGNSSEFSIMYKGKVNGKVLPGLSLIKYNAMRTYG